MPDIRKILTEQHSESYEAYYTGKMSYSLYGQSWDAYVKNTFPSLNDQYTSENIFKVVVDLYAENLMPAPHVLQPFKNTLISLLCRGQAPVIIDSAGVPHFPEHYEMISDGDYHACAVRTRSLADMVDYITYATSEGVIELWGKPVPASMEPASDKGYTHIETSHGTLVRFALSDHGFGRLLAPLQDRINHSIIDQTLIAEMYARPFWYLLNTQLPPRNPYLPKSTVQPDAMEEAKPRGEAGRIFTTSSSGPFGQLTPPTLNDMVAYHAQLIAKVSQVSGIPEYYLNLNSAGVPSGIALKVLSKRFNQKVARVRDSIEPQLQEVCTALHIDFTELWPQADDLLQDSLDLHGLNLKQMGYPTDYIAEVVTPGVNLAEYGTDGLDVNGHSTDY